MSQDFHIRIARPEDAPAVSSVISASYSALLTADYHPKILAKALPRITVARPELLASGTYFVAEATGATAATGALGGGLIGAGGWTDVSPTRGLAAPGEGHMRHLAVHPDHLRLGVGKALAEASFASARDMGVRGLRCLSTITAAPFYAACGFAALQEIELTLEPGLYFPAIEMRKVFADIAA